TDPQFAVESVHPKQRFEHLVLALSLQASDTEDLPAMQVEGYVAKKITGAQVLRPKDDIPLKHLPRGGLRRERLVDIPADHHLHEGSGGRAVDVDRRDVLAISKHGDAIADRENLFHAM